MSDRRTVSKDILRLLCAVATSVLLAACGDDERPGAAPVGTPENPAVARPQARETEPANRRKPGARRATATPGYESLVGSQKSRPHQRFTPCNLVTKTQAQAILGSRILTPKEASLGPTCIYQTPRATKFVTLAVQSADMADLKRRLREIRRVEISSRPAFCGRLGQAVLYLPLAGVRVLSISAPCATAQRFAAIALSRLGP